MKQFFLLVLPICFTLVFGCENGYGEFRTIIVQRPADIVYETDIVVVGGGGAGFSAALAAAQQGLDVMLVEQLYQAGGNTVLAGGAGTVVRTNADHNVLNPVGNILTNHHGLLTVLDVPRILAMDINAPEYAWIWEEVPIDYKPRADEAVKKWQAALRPQWEHWLANHGGNSSGTNGLPTNRIFDSIYLHMLQTFEEGDFAADPALVELLCAHAMEAYSWLFTAGAQEPFPVGGIDINIYRRVLDMRSLSADNAFGGGSISGPGRGFVRPQQARFGQMALMPDGSVPATIFEASNTLLGHRAEKIVMDNGRVAGIIGTFSGGIFQINAQAVIIASGGFSANWDMLEKYQPNTMARFSPAEDGLALKWANLRDYTTSNNHASATGQMIEATRRDTGAAFYQMDQIQLLPPSLNANNIFVTIEGKRFVNENGRRDQAVLAFIREREKGLWSLQITSAALTANNPPTNMDAALDLGRRALNNVHGWPLDITGWNAEQLAARQTFAANFIDAMVEYNRAIRDEEVDWTGKTVRGSERGVPATGWGLARQGRPEIHHTMGGLRINTKTEVLNDAGNIIPGLYAAGEASGGIHGRNRVGGNALTEILVFGKIAGESAASYVKTQ